ncbi:Predicted phosphoesterase [Verrucomicrobium sp. GAS474]|uniref:metallophosphoesterase family protein n=1 Tax=Verrucomicrobium sp. GAS474 TaxID=1882831 RepID=UPI00087DBF3F|nr:metallophosphoesterase [Verrucomicrobium sp. GAS474]SDU18356.1 Predicted phosphoesterase [Verrucomicrobium sp. GAS474]
MRILVAGDLHNRKEWFAWLSTQVAQFDLVALPGDLLDIFQPDLPRQRAFVEEWFAAEAEKGTALAWCSGNHDGGRWFTNRIEGPCWTDRLRFPSVVGDLECKEFVSLSGERFLVSCIPHSEAPTESWESAVESLLTQGWQKRQELSWCPWIVLAHNPPVHTAVAATPNDSGGSDHIRLWVERFQPDYLLSGHLHQAPDLGSFRAELGQCLCLNPGYVEEAEMPSHITVDTRTKAVLHHRGTAS